MRFIGVAGFTVPGTRVDVLVTLKDGESSMTRAVVSNVQLLTADPIRQEQAKDAKRLTSSVSRSCSRLKTRTHCTGGVGRSR